MQTTLPRSIARTFTPKRVSLLVETLQHIYANTPSQAECPGFNATCVGTTLYQTTGETFAELAGLDGLHVGRENNAFLFRLDDVPFTIQRVGRDLGVDISAAYPRNFRPHDHHSGQMTIDWDLGMPAMPAAPPLVLAHVGNEKDGLVSAYLCRPSRVENGRIRAWEFAFSIFDTGVTSAQLPAAEATIPPVERIGRATVRRRTKSDSDQA